MTCHGWRRLLLNMESKGREEKVRSHTVSHDYPRLGRRQINDRAVKGSDYLVLNSFFSSGKIIDKSSSCVCFYWRVPIAFSWCTFGAQACTKSTESVRDGERPTLRKPLNTGICGSSSERGRSPNESYGPEGQGFESLIACQEKDHETIQFRGLLVYMRGESK